MDCALLPGIFQENKVNLHMTSSKSGEERLVKIINFTHQVKSSIFRFLSWCEIDDFEQAFLDHLSLKRVQMLGFFWHFAHQFFKIKTE